jgi:hypothetical protein
VPPRDPQAAHEALRDQFTRRYRDLAPPAVKRLLAVTYQNGNPMRTVNAKALAT